MARRKTKRSTGPAPKPAPPLPKATHRSRIEDTQVKPLQHSQDDELTESVRLSEEIKQILSGIYSMYFNDFEDRLAKRLNGNVLAEVLTYTIQVDKIIQADCKKKIRRLVELINTSQAYVILLNAVNVYSMNIRASMLKVKDPKERIMSLLDAYHVTMNISEEVGSFTLFMFNDHPLINCERLNVACLFTAIREALEDSVQWISLQKKVNPSVKKVVDLFNDLKCDQVEMSCIAMSSCAPLHGCCSGSHNDCTEAIRTSKGTTHSDDRENEGNLCCVSIDDLVQFIEPSSAKPKGKKPTPTSLMQTASNSSSPLKSTSEDDQEVEELKTRLAGQRPAQHRIKPNLKKSWLKSLR